MLNFTSCVIQIPLYPLSSNTPLEIDFVFCFRLKGWLCVSLSRLAICHTFPRHVCNFMMNEHVLAEKGNVHDFSVSRLPLVARQQSGRCVLQRPIQELEQQGAMRRRERRSPRGQEGQGMASCGSVNPSGNSRVRGRLQSRRGHTVLGA